MIHVCQKRGLSFSPQFEKYAVTQNYLEVINAANIPNEDKNKKNNLTGTTVAFRQDYWIFYTR